MITRRLNLGDFEQIDELIEEYEPIHIYVGAPKHMSGAPSASMLKAEEFKDSISERSGITCSMVDERLSTVGAAKQLKESGMSTRESKAAIDQAAAVAILEQALAIEKRK